MWSHVRTRALLAAVIAGVCASAGCLNPYLNPFPPYPPYPPYGYPPQPPADKSAPPPVDNRNAESVTRAQYQPPTTPPGSVGLPTPMPVPVPPTQPQAVPPPRAMGGNPHERTTPTTTGRDWALGPNELPIDRVAEQQRRLDEMAEEYRKLQARIVTLEANGLSREQALNEALREVKDATDLVTKVRGDMQALRTELVTLRERVKKAEEGELDTLNKVIRVLQELLDEK